MNNRQLIEEIARHYDGDRQAAARALSAVTASITRGLGAGERVRISDFGSFDRREVAARWVRNPRTGERILAEATAVARFRPGVVLKAIVAGRREAAPAPELPRKPTKKSAQKSAQKSAEKSAAKAKKKTRKPKPAKPS